MNRAVRQHTALPAAQCGAVVLLLLLILAVSTASYFLVKRLNGNILNTERAKITAAALAQAKEALIGYAVSINLAVSGPRPGDLPCPDNHLLGDPDEGTADSLCSGDAIGRLPWKTLNLPDLRDAAGERLWYAVSSRFKKAPRTGTLNSDTFGTITVQDANGNIIYNGTNSTGAIAVIIAPGQALVRQDGYIQTRSGAAYVVAKNFLDMASGEDNADFVNSGTNGFINGVIKDAAGNVLVNDSLTTIDYAELMPLLEKRVVREAFNCLTDYADQPENKGRYPWAASISNSAASNDYSDVADNRFGRLPETFANTIDSSLTIGSPPTSMKDNWTTACSLTVTWWKNNWREQVFYSLADAFKPVSPLTIPGCGTCLLVSSPSSTPKTQIVVMVAGKTLTGQLRNTNARRGNSDNYLEDANRPLPFNSADDSYAQQAATSTFNDVLLFR